MNTMTNETKCNDWYPETRSLFRSLKAAGFEIYEIENGEDAPFKAEGKSEEQCLQVATACDECRISVKKDGKRRGLYLVFGNEPGVLLSDYTCDDDLDKVADAHYTKWENMGQPKIGEADWMARATKKF